MMSSSPSVPELLRHVPIFSAMADGELAELGGLAHVRSFLKSAVVFEEGDEGSELLIVTHGLLKVRAVSEDGKEFILTINRPYDCLGEIAILDGAPRSAGATAMEDLELLSIRKRDLDGFLERHPRLKDSIICLLCARLRHLTSEVLDFAFLSVYYRVIKKLLELADSFGAGEGAAVVIDRKLTHQEFAGMTGTTREMITKILNDLKKRRLLEASRGRLVIPPGGREKLEDALHVFGSRAHRD